MKFIGVPFSNFSELMAYLSTITDREITAYQNYDFAEQTIELDLTGDLNNVDLRQIVTLGLCVPDDITWMKISQEVAESLILSELGDDTKIFNTQFYTRVVNDEYYCVVGRTSTVKQIVDGVEVEVPTGNWQGSLSFDIFNAFIDTFGIDNLYIKLPEVELEDEEV